MKLYEVIDNVQFTYTEDSEHENRSWQVDRVDAFIDGKPVGYLKIAYIPQEKFDQFFPGILNYLDQVKGSSLFPTEYKTTRWQDIPTDILKKTVYHLGLLADMTWNESNRLVKQVTDYDQKQLHGVIDGLERKIKKSKGLEFRRFRTYFVNKPYVDYINVEDDYKRQGIGTKLYRAGYEWMKSKGMTLFASGIQSKEAAAVWDKLQKQYPVNTVQMPAPQARTKKVTRRYFAG